MNDGCRRPKNVDDDSEAADKATRFDESWQQMDGYGRGHTRIIGEMGRVAMLIGLAP